jgi:hypothetical protein
MITMMKKKYSSKIGLEIAIPLSLILGIVLFLSIYEKPSWLGLVLLAPLILMIIYLFKNTDYTIDGESLIIRCGFLYHKTILIQNIRKITETNNPMSSPATSLDRLEILDHEHQAILISPQQKEAFIEQIHSINPNIVIKRKSK